METASEQLISLLTFDGKHESFMTRWTHFSVFAMMYKFVEALKSTTEADLPVLKSNILDESTDVGKRQASVKKCNHVPVANFTMAFTSKGTMLLVYKAITVNWPNGLAHLIVKALEDKYHLQDTMMNVELCKQLNWVSMKANQDLATLFEQLSGIENHYKHSGKQMDVEDQIAVMIDSASTGYCEHPTTVW